MFLLFSSRILHSDHQWQWKRVEYQVQMYEGGLPVKEGGGGV